MSCLRLLVALSVLSICSQAWADKRVALVIGNSAYQHATPLANPKNDAADMAVKLESLGFQVVSGRDLDLPGMRGTVREFVKLLEGADMALFYYSGHGLQVSGTNYMAPVDAQLSAYDDLDFETLPMDLILSAMERNSKVNLVFLDACRDNPLADNLARSMGTRSGSIGRGLAKLGSGVGSLIAFATQPGNIAFDGSGRNSPFTSALLRHLGTPGQDITRELIYVRRDVLEATDGRQVPWDSSSLTGDVVLNPVATKDRQAQSPVVEPSSIPDTAVELAYWETIKDSADRDFFEAYLKQFPSGAFASLAKLKIEAIDKRAEQERQAAERQRAESDQLERERAAKAANDPTVVEIAKLEQPTLPTLTESMQTGELVVATQRELARIGCLAGRVDGVWGSGSQKALRAYANRQGVNLASAEPTSELLKGLKTIQNRVCPLACVDGMQERNGRCESDSAPGLSAFNGMWRLTRRATNSSCGWREIETQIFITDGEIAADTHWRGTISNNGRIRINHDFVYQGESGRNVVTGAIKGDRGTGKFKHVGGDCAGVVEIRRM